MSVEYHQRTMQFSEPTAPLRSQQSQPLHLADYIVVLWRRKTLVVLALVVCVGLSLVYSFLEAPSYQARAELLVRLESPTDLLEQRRVQDAKRLLANEVRLMESQVVRDEVRKAYTGSLNPGSVSAAVAGSDADVISLSVSSGDPNEAAHLVNVYVDVYRSFRQQQEVNDLLAAGAEVRRQADELQQQIAAISQPLTDLDAQISAAGPSRRDELLAQRSLKVAELSSQLSPLQSQLAFYQEQLDRLEITAGVRQAGAIDVLYPAVAPTAPVAPRPARNVVLALALGLMLGVAGALLIDHFDDSLKNKEALEMVSGKPVIALIPRVARRRGHIDELITETYPSSVPAEAYRLLRTSVKFLGIDNPAKVIQVTSASSGEGKTMTTANLAMALAQAGDRVVIVGCDLRRPRIDELFDVPPGPGITSVLLGEATLGDAIVDNPERPRLSVLRSGTPAPNPSELLSTSRAEQLIETLRHDYDIVLLDCAPVLPVPDALVVSKYADLTLLIAAERRTSRRSVARAVELLGQVNAPLTGTVLNEAGDSDGFAQGYSYYAYSQKNGNSRSNGVGGGKLRKERRASDLKQQIVPSHPRR